MTINRNYLPQIWNNCWINITDNSSNQPQSINHKKQNHIFETKIRKIQIRRVHISLWCKWHKRNRIYDNANIKYLFCDLKKFWFLQFPPLIKQIMQISKDVKFSNFWLPWSSTVLFKEYQTRILFLSTDFRKISPRKIIE